MYEYTGYSSDTARDQYTPPPALACIFEAAPASPNQTFLSASSYHLRKQPISFLHYHLEMEIGYCVSGHGSLYLGDRIIPYKTGDVQVVLPLQPHYNVSETDKTVWHFVSFSPDALHSENVAPSKAFTEYLAQNAKACGVFSPDRFPALAQSVADVTETALRAPQSPFDRDALLVRCLHFLTLLGNTDEMDSPNRSILNVNKILPALIGFSKSLEQGACLSITEMAELCHFSTAYFRKIFAEQMGMQPKRYILSEQLKRAKQLLASTDYPISKIWQSVGFTDSSVFFRNFTNQFHCSPTAYREAKRAAARQAAENSAERAKSDVLGENSTQNGE